MSQAVRPHERYDGSGYRGDEIPLGARIIHLADALRLDADDSHVP